MLLKFRIGELSAEWRSLKTRYRRNSGPKRRLWLPRIQVKLPTKVWTSEEATPSPDSDWLSVVSEPIWTFGTPLSPGDQVHQGRREAERGEIEALADAVFRELLLGEAVAEIQQEGGAEHVHVVEGDGAVDAGSG